MLAGMSSFPIQLPRRRPHPGRTPGARSQLGVALIESLVSVLIFSIGVIGLIGLQARAIDFSVDAEDRNRAAVLSNEIASGMWLTNSVTVTAAQLATYQTNVADVAHSGLPNGTVTITPTPGTTRAADIVLTWKPQTDAAAVPSRQLTTRVILP
jgi:type IV pilus assembly protein PilV